MTQEMQPTILQHRLDAGFCGMLAGIMIGFLFAAFYQSYLVEKPKPQVISLNPVRDFGAVCDMKTDDTKEFILAGNLAGRLGGIVEVPDNCVVKEVFLKTGSGHFVGKSTAHEPSN